MTALIRRILFIRYLPKCNKILHCATLQTIKIYWRHLMHSSIYIKKRILYVPAVVNYIHFLVNILKKKKQEKHFIGMHLAPVRIRWLTNESKFYLLYREIKCIPIGMSISNHIKCAYTFWWHKTYSSFIYWIQTPYSYHVIQ